MTEDEKIHAKNVAVIEDLQLERGLIKPMKNPENPEDRFILYFLPDERTTRKRTRPDSDLKEEDVSKLQAFILTCELIFNHLD